MENCKLGYVYGQENQPKYTAIFGFWCTYGFGVHGPLNFCDCHLFQFLKAPHYPNSMVMPLVTNFDTINAINSLKNKKGHIDEIPVRLIKENKEILAIPLTILFNQSVNTGTFPDRFKIGKIVPIFKSGDKSDVSNYRPISILPLFSKIFEFLMKKHLTIFLEKMKILNNNQFGFRSGMSTFDALNTFTSDLYTSLNNNKSILSIFIDFRKAFDTIQPTILLDKMSHYGIRGCINDWFRSYLINRTQYTNFESKSSTTTKINLGVPQGSLLGPVLFIIYINDIFNISNRFNTILFADDSTLYMIGDHPTELINEANNELQKFTDWCLANKLTINTNKTYFMIFSKLLTKYYPLPNLTMLNDSISQVYQTKFLGVFFDSNLSFKPHISNLCLKLSRTIPLLLKVRYFVPEAILKCLYYAHIYPHLNYCNPIWSNTYACHLKQLNVLHKKTIRIMTNSNYCQHTPPLFKSLNILNLTDLSKFSIGTYMFKQINTQRYNTRPLHPYPTRNQLLLQIPRHKQTLFTHSLLYLGPKIWNDIPSPIQNTQNSSTFKSNYKDYLLSLY